jgi:hypothetical protein
MEYISQYKLVNRSEKNECYSQMEERLYPKMYLPKHIIPQTPNKRLTRNIKVLI